MQSYIYIYRVHRFDVIHCFVPLQGMEISLICRSQVKNDCWNSENASKMKRSRTLGQPDGVGVGKVQLSWLCPKWTCHAVWRNEAKDLSITKAITYLFLSDTIEPLIKHILFLKWENLVKLIDTWCVSNKGSQNLFVFPFIFFSFWTYPDLFFTEKTNTKHNEETKTAASQETFLNWKPPPVQRPWWKRLSLEAFLFKTWWKVAEINWWSKHIHWHGDYYGDYYCDDHQKSSKHIGYYRYYC